MRDSLRFASVVAVGLSVACGGAPAPRPAATAAAATTAPPAAAEPTGLPPGHPPIAPGAGQAPRGARAETRLSGTIGISPRLSAGPGDVLYVMARKGAATLVVRRIEKPVFPLEFELSDDDAMVSGMPFEGPVDVVARLSRTGDAIPAKGDLEGVRKDVAVPSTAVRVTIDSVRP